MKQRFRSHTHGFTLVELLVVVLIMTILLTIGASAIKGAGGKGVSTAIATTEALFDEARGIAVGRGVKSRLLVDANPDSDGYLRRIITVYQATDDLGNPAENSWIMSARGFSMPDKTFFSQEFSSKNHKGAGGKIEKMQLARQNNITTTYQGEYYFYEFNSEGISQSPGASFVIGAGVLPPGDTEPRTIGEGKRDFAGFVVWRNGSTSVFRDPSQILGSASPTTF